MAETRLQQRQRKDAASARKKKMRYFESDWKYASYIGAGITMILSIAIGFTVGKYKPQLPYIIPSGNGTRADGTPWTLFHQPWVIPHAASASFTDTVIGLGVVIALIPVTYVSINNYRYVKSVEKNIPRFLRDILESTDSGIILPTALIRASTSDYGPISSEIGIAMTKFSLGYDFKESVMEACAKSETPLHDSGRTCDCRSLLIRREDARCTELQRRPFQRTRTIY